MQTHLGVLLVPVSLVPRYWFCHARVKLTWTQIESTLQDGCSVAFGEFMASFGLSERELDRLEQKLGIHLPDDYRCSMRLQGVQSISLGAIKYCDDAGVIQHTMLHLLGSELIEMEPGWDPQAGIPLCLHCTKHLRMALAACASLLMVTDDDGAEYSKVPVEHVFLAYSISVPIHISYHVTTVLDPLTTSPSVCSC